MSKKKRILLTRSEAENNLLSTELMQSSYKDQIETIQLELISYKDIKFNFNLINIFPNIIITSKYAAQTIPSNTSNQYAYVVGEKSARILRDKGYKIKYVASNVSGLEKRLKEDAKDGGRGEFVYLSGDHITLEMPPFVNRVIIYQTLYKQSLNEDEISSIQQGVDIIPVYSQNCAKTLIKLLESEQLIKNVANSHIIAISFNVGRILSKIFQNVVISESPTQVTRKILEYVE